MALAAPINLCLDGGPYNYGSVTPGASYTLSWDAVSGAYGYSVYYSETQDGSYTWVKDVATTSTTVNAPDTYSTYRYFKVRTMSSTGNEDSGLSSEYRSMYTKASPADTCTLPTTYYLDGIASNISGVAPGSQWTLSWTGATGAISDYSVSYTDTGGYPLQYLGRTSSQSIQVTAPETPLTTRRFIVSVNSSVLGGDAYAGVDGGITLTTGSGTPVEPPPFTSTTGIAYFNGTQWSTAMPWCYTNIGWVKPTVHQYINGGWTKIWPLTAECSYTVESISGVQYGFTLNSAGYYESTNHTHNSFALCKIKIISDGINNTYIDYIHYGESGYDYGIISALDTTLTQDYTSSTTGKHAQFSTAPSLSVRTLDYGVIPRGEHFVYAKYRKDQSNSEDPDSLQFKVRFGGQTEPAVCSYNVVTIDGAYSFTLNGAGYYESTNKTDSTYALCRVDITTDGIKNLYVDYINSGEQSYDFGLISSLDTILSSTDGFTSTNKHEQFDPNSSKDVKTINFGVLPAKQYFIYVKYQKDVSYTDPNSNDSMQFRIRFV